MMSCVKISCEKLKIACCSFYAEVKAEWGEESNFTREQKEEIILFDQLLRMVYLSELSECLPIELDGRDAESVLKQLSKHFRVTDIHVDSLDPEHVLEGVKKHYQIKELKEKRKKRNALFFPVALSVCVILMGVILSARVIAS
jgi:hypothetical protein